MVGGSLSVANAAVGGKDLLASVSVVVGAGIAAFVAWFNARKTPADRLQEFLDMYRQWPDGLPGAAHVADLIRGQIGEMWHRYPHSNLYRSATVPDPCSGTKPQTQIPETNAAIDRIAQHHLVLDTIACALGALAVITSVVVFVCSGGGQDVAVPVGLIGGFALVVVVWFGARLLRHRVMKPED